MQNLNGYQEEDDKNHFSGGQVVSGPLAQLEVNKKENHLEEVYVPFPGTGMLKSKKSKALVYNVELVFD